MTYIHSYHAKLHFIHTYIHTLTHIFILTYMEMLESLQFVWSASVLHWAGLLFFFFKPIGTLFFSLGLIFSMMSLIRQHSKKGNFVSSNASLLERDLDIASCPSFGPKRTHTRTKKPNSTEQGSSNQSWALAVFSVRKVVFNTRAVPSSENCLLLGKYY